MDQTLFNQSNEQDAPDNYFVFTNNNNLRHFLSGDRIVSKILFETDKYDPDLSTFYENYILISRVAISSKTLEAFKSSIADDTVYPIALKMVFREEKSITAKLVTKDFSIIESTLDKFNSESHLFALIRGFIPARFISKIIFQSLDNQVNFDSLKHTISNINIEDELYVIEEGVFQGDLEFDINELNKLKDNQELIDADIDNQLLMKNNKVRAFYHCFLEASSIQPNESLTLHFDSKSLGIISNALKISNYSSEADFKEIISQIIEYLTSGGEVIDNQSILFHDNKLFNIISLRETIESVLLRKDFQHSNVNSRDIEEIYDAYSFQLVTYLLLTAELENFNPTTFLIYFTKQIADYLPEDADNLDYDQIDKIKNIYTRVSAIIENILSGRGISQKISDLFRRIPENSLTLKCLTFLLLNYQPDKFFDLKNKLEKFELNNHEKRIILSFYGALNGMRPLTSDFKSNRDNLELSDIIANSYLNTIEGFPEFYHFDRRNRKSNIKVWPTYKDAQSNRQIIALQNGLGFTFYAEYQDSIRIIVSEILKLVETKKDKEIQELYINKLESQSFLRWIIRYPAKTSITINSISNELEIVSPVEPKIIKEWNDWRGFIKKFIQDYKLFKQIITKDDLKLLKNIIKRNSR